MAVRRARAERPVTTLPGEPVPYVIEAGSGRAHVLLGEVGRALVGAEESAGAMSVMSLDGPRADRPIPLHFHDEEYELFYCLRGAIQLWAEDESRVLAPGDFAFIPPGTLHAYQLRGHHSTFVGPIVPGGWDRFFDLTGEPFATAAFPQGPKGPPPFAKFGQAEQQFKMKYRPDAQYAVAGEGADDTLPAAQQAYFLRSGEGPRHELAGQLQTLLLGSGQTEGRVTMTTVELAKGPGLPNHVHERTYESLMVIEGRLRVTLDGAEHVLTRGDTASIPAGTEHAYRGDGHYTKVLTMSAPGGLEKLIATAGAATREHVFGTGGALDLDALREAATGLDVSFA
ncbi:MAG TPA: quercetin 2,3-dioxygenase [Solirubrobacter sp.]